MFIISISGETSALYMGYSVLEKAVFALLPLTFDPKKTHSKVTFPSSHKVGFSQLQVGWRWNNNIYMVVITPFLHWFSANSRGEIYYDSYEVGWYKTQTYPGVFQVMKTWVTTFKVTSQHPGVDLNHHYFTKGPLLAFISHTIHVWSIYPRLVDFYGKCRQITLSSAEHTWWGYFTPKSVEVFPTLLITGFWAPPWQGWWCNWLGTLCTEQLDGALQSDAREATTGRDKSLRLYELKKHVKQ